MTYRCAAEQATGHAKRTRAPLFTTWHALRRHIDLCRTSTAMCPPS